MILSLRMSAQTTSISENSSLSGYLGYGALQGNSWSWSKLFWMVTNLPESEEFLSHMIVTHSYGINGLPVGYLGNFPHTVFLDCTPNVSSLSPTRTKKSWFNCRKNSLEFWFASQSYLESAIFQEKVSNPDSCYRAVAINGDLEQGHRFGGQG